MYDELFAPSHAALLQFGQALRFARSVLEPKHPSVFRKDFGVRELVDELAELGVKISMGDLSLMEQGRLIPKPEQWDAISAWLGTVAGRARQHRAERADGGGADRVEALGEAGLGSVGGDGDDVADDHAEDNERQGDDHEEDDLGVVHWAGGMTVDRQGTGHFDSLRFSDIADDVIFIPLPGHDVA